MYTDLHVHGLTQLKLACKEDTVQLLAMYTGSASHMHFVVTRVIMKILCTGSKHADCRRIPEILRFLPVSHRIDIRTARFLGRFSTSENSLWQCLL